MASDCAPETVTDIDVAVFKHEFSFHSFHMISPFSIVIVFFDLTFHALKGGAAALGRAVSVLSPVHFAGKVEDGKVCGSAVIYVSARQPEASKRAPSTSPRRGGAGRCVPVLTSPVYSTGKANSSPMTPMRAARKPSRFLLVGVGRGIRRHHVDSAVREPFDERRPVLRRADGRVHLEPAVLLRGRLR